jgi:hypothetical protein
VGVVVRSGHHILTHFFVRMFAFSIINLPRYRRTGYQRKNRVSNSPDVYPIRSQIVIRRPRFTLVAL